MDRNKMINEELNKLLEQYKHYNHARTLNMVKIITGKNICRSNSKWAILSQYAMHIVDRKLNNNR